jgi:hypothetical protein
MNAMAIDYPGARTATGTVVQVGLTGTSLTLMSRNGTTRTYQTGGNFELVQQLALGDVASVAYTTTPGVSATDGAFVARASAAPPVTTAHSVQLKAAAGPAQVSGTVTALTAGGASFKLHTASGTNQTFATAGGDQTFTTAGSVGMLRNVRVGDAITVSFVQANGGVPIAEQLQIAAAGSQNGTLAGTAPPTTTPAPTTPIATAPAGATPIGR